MPALLRNPAVRRRRGLRRAAGVLTVLAALCAAAPAPAQGEDSAGGDDPYRAGVPAADQSNATRDAGLRQALEQVLVRVSGGTQGLSPILPRALSLVQHYQFERDGTGAQQLVARFDPRGVQAALREQGLPVFGRYEAAAEEVLLSVDGVRTAADYSRALAYLRDLPAVKSLAVRELAAATLILRLSVEGGEPQLASAVQSGGVLRPGAGARYLLINQHP